MSRLVAGKCKRDRFLLVYICSREYCDFASAEKVKYNEDQIYDLKQKGVLLDSRSFSYTLVDG